LLREFNVPVYATKLTLGLVRSKLQEFGHQEGRPARDQGRRHPEPRRVSARVRQRQPLHPDAVAVAIRTNAGLIVFSGDYKIDLTP
jgi:ribonuclease J